MTWSDRTTAPAFLLVTRFLFLDGLFFTHTKNLTSLACSCTTHCLWNSVIELLCSQRAKAVAKIRSFLIYFQIFRNLFFNQPENHQKQPDSLPESGCKSRYFFITEQIYQTLFLMKSRKKSHPITQHTEYQSNFNTAKKKPRIEKSARIEIKLGKTDVNTWFLRFKKNLGRSGEAKATACHWRALSPTQLATGRELNQRRLFHRAKEPLTGEWRLFRRATRPLTSEW